MLDMSALRDWRFSIDMQGIAWAVFDREGESQNSLGRRPLEELAEIVQKVEEGARSGAIRGLVIYSGKERGFIVGADIREFADLKSEMDVIDKLRPVNALFDRIERFLQVFGHTVERLRQIAHLIFAQRLDPI